MNKTIQQQHRRHDINQYNDDKQHMQRHMQQYTLTCKRQTHETKQQKLGLSGLCGKLSSVADSSIRHSISCIVQNHPTCSDNNHGMTEQEPMNLAV